MKQRKNDQSISDLLGQRKLLKTVVSGLTETITNYTQCPADPGKPFIRHATKEDSPAVGGLIRFEGESLSMVLFLGLSKDLFLALYNNMFQMEIEDVSAENADIAGEILNISFGIMDPKFREMGFQLKSSLPKIYFKDSLQEVMKSLGQEALVIPYTTMGKSFFVEIYAAEVIDIDWQFDISAA